MWNHGSRGNVSRIPLPRCRGTPRPTAAGDSRARCHPRACATALAPLRNRRIPHTLQHVGGRVQQLRGARISTTRLVLVATRILAIHSEGWSYIDYSPKLRGRQAHRAPRKPIEICFTILPRRQALDVPTVDQTRLVTERQRFTKSACPRGFLAPNSHAAWPR
jgi:hypothetical protein